MTWIQRIWKIGETELNHVTFFWMRSCEFHLWKNFGMISCSLRVKNYTKSESCSHSWTQNYYFYSYDSGIVQDFKQFSIVIVLGKARELFQKLNCRIYPNDFLSFLRYPLNSPTYLTNLLKSKWCSKFVWF